MKGRLIITLTVPLNKESIGWIGSFHVKSTTYGRHVTDFAEILHTTWDMKKNLDPEDERSETSEAGVMAPESF